MFSGMVPPGRRTEPSTYLSSTIIGNKPISTIFSFDAPKVWSDGLNKTISSSWASSELSADARSLCFICRSFDDRKQVLSGFGLQEQVPYEYAPRPAPICTLGAANQATVSWVIPKIRTRKTACISTPSPPSVPHPSHAVARRRGRRQIEVRGRRPSHFLDDSGFKCLSLWTRKADSESQSRCPDVAPGPAARAQPAMACQAELSPAA